MLEQLRLLEKEKRNNTDYTAEPYTGLYAMHKYWSKKPYNIIRNFILKHTHRGDIILDPFCGSGISILESIITGRKVIGIDINPSAIFITTQMINRISTRSIAREFRKLESEVKDEINSFYVVERKDKFIGTHFIWKNGELVEVWYKKGRKKITEEVTEDDIKLALSFSYESIPYFYPKDRFFQNSRINANRENCIYHLFTPRNLMALSLLMDRIEKIEKDSVREFFKYCFTASVGQASKMVFVIKKRGKTSEKSKKSGNKEVGSWVIGYWVPKEHFEINVWNCYKNKYSKIMKAKKIQENTLYGIKEAETFEKLLDSNFLLINEPAQKALKKIPDNSVDYVITDPPHGNRQPYLELSMMWNSWLKKEASYEDEIVISDSKDRKKDIYNYYQLLYEVFVEIERILKLDHYFSLLFNSLDDETWEKLLMNMNNLSFALEKVETLSYSANSVVQDTRKTGLKTDFILTFRKIPHHTIKNIKLISVKTDRDYIVDLIETCLGNNKEKGLYTYQILNFLVLELLLQNKFFKLSEILDILKQEFEMNQNRWTRRRYNGSKT